MYETLAILAAFLFVYSGVAGRLERTPISGPVVFLAFGLAAGPFGLGLFKLDVNAEALKTIAELTLALVLFTDAANANLPVLERSFRIPVRLLLIGLPLTILLGFAAGALVFDGLSVLELAVLATMLAPTDAALGKAVVTNKAVPTNIREGLNVESGLNDGICVPILFVFLALAVGVSGEGGTTGLALRLVAEELGIGLVVGVGLAVLGTFFFRQFASRGWIAAPWTELPVIALAFTCFGVAQSTGGSGFIACFVGGLTYGAMAKLHKEEFLRAAEGIGDGLALVTWVIFGSAVVGQSLGHFTWPVLVYAVLSLTVVRMLPVFLSVTGLGLRVNDKLFLGWFGPRGLASIVFGVIVLNKSLPGGDTLSAVVVCTVVLSILGHGLSANPLAAAYGARSKPE
jgi:NhaP-type Na+/H+ or K+/H+ antiporter